MVDCNFEVNKVPEVFQLKYSKVFIENILLARFFCLLKRVKKLMSVQSFQYRLICANRGSSESKVQVSRSWIYHNAHKHNQFFDKLTSFYAKCVIILENEWWIVGSVTHLRHFAVKVIWMGHYQTQDVY